VTGLVDAKNWDYLIGFLLYLAGLVTIFCSAIDFSTVEAVIISAWQGKVFMWWVVAPVVRGAVTDIVSCKSLVDTVICI